MPHSAARYGWPRRIRQMTESVRQMNSASVYTQAARETARKQARQSLTTLRNAKKRHVGEQLE